MTFNPEMKQALIHEIKECLALEREIRKIIIFGSFIKSEEPKDIDLAIIQDSNDKYLTLALKYRRLTRKVAEKIPIDIIPIRFNMDESWFLSEVKAGEIIYEK